MLVDGCGGDFQRPSGNEVQRGKIWVCEEQMAKLASLGGGLLGLGRVTNQKWIDPCGSGSRFRAAGTPRQ